MQHFVISFQDFALRVKLKKEFVSLNISQSVIASAIQHFSGVWVSIIAGTIVVYLDVRAVFLPSQDILQRLTKLRIP